MLNTYVDLNKAINRSFTMFNELSGQCGTCTYFGRDIPEQQLVQIRLHPHDDEQTIGGCGLPSNANMHLRVSANSSCDGYQAAG